MDQNENQKSNIGVNNSADKGTGSNNNTDNNNQEFEYSSGSNKIDTNEDIIKLLERIGLSVEDFKDVTDTMNSDDIRTLKKVLRQEINKRTIDREINDLYESAYEISEKAGYKEPGLEMFQNHNVLGQVKDVKKRKNSYEGKSELDRINVGVICTDQVMISSALSSDSEFYESNVDKLGNKPNDTSIVIDGKLRPASLSQEIFFIEKQS